jgi:hypothetical protein
MENSARPFFPSPKGSGRIKEHGIIADMPEFSNVKTSFVSVPFSVIPSGLPIKKIPDFEMLPLSYKLSMNTWAIGSRQ